MKIEQKVFAEFLDKISMEGDALVTEAILDFTETGLQIGAMCATQVVRVDGKLLPQAFTEYEAIKKIGVQNIPELVRIIKKFDKDIALTVQGNLLTIKSGSKKVEVTLVDLKFIEQPQDIGDISFTENFNADMKHIGDFYDDMSMNKGANITFTTTPKKCILSCDGKYKFTYDLVADELKGGVVTKFGSVLADATKKLKSKVSIGIGNDYPIRILEKTEKSMVSVIVAPRVADEQSTSEEVSSEPAQ